MVYILYIYICIYILHNMYHVSISSFLHSCAFPSGMSAPCFHHVGSAASSNLPYGHCQSLIASHTLQLPPAGAAGGINIEGWNCLACTMANAAHLDCCQICGSPKVRWRHWRKLEFMLALKLHLNATVTPLILTWSQQMSYFYPMNSHSYAHSTSVPPTEPN
jgi:hypothetical protein